MHFAELPDDLAELERQLATRRMPEPSAGFRLRLLAVVAETRNRSGSGGDAGGLWRFAALVAAALLLGINLSLSVAKDTSWHLNAGIDAERVTATAARLHALVPDLPEQEAFRQALVWQAAAQLPPVPDCRPQLNGLLEEQQRQFHEMR